MTRPVGLFLTDYLAGLLQGRDGYSPPIAILPVKKCQFIAGEPTALEDCKCLLPVMPGSPYCPEHHSLVYEKGSSLNDKRRKR